MKTTLALGDFRDAFIHAERKDQFSYYGLEALFDYLTDYEESTGEEMELDVIALCCDFTEYGNIKEYNRDYPPVESIDEIEELTTVIRIDGEDGFIIQNY